MQIVQDNAALAVLTLNLADEMFAIEATGVREILDMVPVTEVPGAEAFISRLINVRGRVVPLADLRLKLGLKQRPPTIDTRIVVMEAEIDGRPLVFGIQADKVYEVAELPTASLEDVPRIGLRWPAGTIRAIGKRAGDFIMVLNVAGLFAGVGSGTAPHPETTHRTDDSNILR